MCVAPRFLVVPLSELMWEVMVSYVDCLPSSRASWLMCGGHVECIFCVLYVKALGFYVLWISMFLGCRKNLGGYERR